MTQSKYREAGVDIDAQDAALGEIKKLVAATRTEGVLSELGAFGGLFRPPGGLKDPVLVASADGVGTKLSVARQLRRWDTIGGDLVNHCVNDILVQGAVPLFFLDYVAAGKLEPETIVALVRGVSAACRENGCALLGGETAEMPGFYPSGDHELVGFVVGQVDREKILDGSRVRPKDLLIGLPSGGLHTNGYSLARRILFDGLGLSIADRVPGLRDERGVGEILLDPHRSYLPCLRPLLDHPGLHALAHVTGGGLTDNLPRVLPKKHHAHVRMGSWEVPEIFLALAEHGEVATEEMLRVFNMGIGMVLIVDPEHVADVLGRLRRSGESPLPIGTVQKGGSGVVYDFGMGEPGIEVQEE